MKTMHHMDYECGASKIDVREYSDFMYNPENIYNCAECPERGCGCSNGCGNPCGQQQCWVIAHCGDADDECADDYYDDSDTEPDG